MLLLKAYGWSPDRMEQRYFEDPEKVCNDAFVVLGGNSSVGQGTCSICFGDGELVSLACGHAFCKTCWNDRIQAMLGTVGDDVIDVLCMQQGCRCRVNHLLVKDVCKEDVYKRYMYFLCKNFIEHKKSYTFCPVDTCGRAIHYFDTSREEQEIVCKCGQRFCFECGREAHRPTSCEQFMKWNDLLSNDKENMKLVNTISKPCFHCGIATERTDGCNHMTCQKCHGEWCWMCRGDWKTHGQQTGGFYKCNLYEKSEAKKLDMQMNRLAEENKKFLKFYDEYIKYNNLIKEVKSKKEDLEEIQEIKQNTSGCKHISVISDATDACMEAYSVVKYSFVYAFFVKDVDHIYKLFTFRQSLKRILFMKMY